MAFNDFGRMLAHMPLDPASHCKKAFFIKKSCESGFVFKAKDAVDFLKINMTRFEAMERLNSYMGAHLLHLPYKPTATVIVSETQDVQPTAKGLAYLQEWFWINCLTLSLDQQKRVCAALMSPYNSLPLVRLERESPARKLRLSTGLAIVLWQRVLGERPQIFNEHEPNVVFAKNKTTILNPSGVPHELLLDNFGWPECTDVAYQRKGAIHPNSTRISHYYDKQGVLVFKDLTFARKPTSKFAAMSEYSVQYVISGHALWQWMMDCTTVETRSEGNTLARFLLRNGFLSPISDLVVDAVAFSATRGGELSTSALYRISKRGARLCTWGEEYLPADLTEELEDGMLPVAFSVSQGGREPKYNTPWDWEKMSFPRTLLNEAFDRCFNLHVVNDDPGMKLVLKEYVSENHSRETLEFLDTAKPILRMLTHPDDQAGLRRSIAELKRNFLDDNASMQINISGDTSATLRCACQAAIDAEENDESWRLELVESMSLVCASCELMLSESIMGLAFHDAFQVPDLRSYVVSRFGSMPRPVCQT